MHRAVDRGRKGRIWRPRGPIMNIDHRTVMVGRGDDFDLDKPPPLQLSWRLLAEVAELVDALGSGSSRGFPVGVQISPSAPASKTKRRDFSGSRAFFISSPPPLRRGYRVRRGSRPAAPAKPNFRGFSVFRSPEATAGPGPFPGCRGSRHTPGSPLRRTH